MTKRQRRNFGRLTTRPTTHKLVVLSFVGLFCYGAMTTRDGGLDQARTTIEKWVDVRRIIAKEKRDWTLGKELLEGRVELVQEEINSFRAKIEETRASISEAEKKKLEMAEESDRLKAAFSSLEESIVELETRTKLLYDRLPDPIRGHLEAVRQQIPDDVAQTELSLAQRFLGVVGILDGVNKFNRDIHLESEIRELEDGTSAEVRALYVGIGQSYYVTQDGFAAGIGSATDAGWTWRPADEHAAQIQQAIEILEGKQDATFVQLPIRID